MTVLVVAEDGVVLRVIDAAFGVFKLNTVLYAFLLQFVEQIEPFTRHLLILKLKHPRLLIILLHEVNSYGIVVYLGCSIDNLDPLFDRAAALALQLAQQ